ncbi:MAG TPA: hypothetical protein EYI72_00320 [Pelagibacteraceae bacterium]|nr:hypothetical protein [Pelagibacteraceae bacterium]
MKKLFLYFISFLLFFNIAGNSDEISPVKQDFEEVFNVGKMLSHDDKFTLYFRTREKAVLARGGEFNYITDYPQDLYILYNDTGKTSPVITYDWFPKKVKELTSSYNLPVFPEDYAYYLLSDNETLIMISGVKSIRSNFKFNLQTNKLEKLPVNNNYKLYVSSLLKNCGYKDINATYKCSFYKPLISENLIN